MTGYEKFIFILAGIPGFTRCIFNTAANSKPSAEFRPAAKPLPAAETQPAAEPQPAEEHEPAANPQPAATSKSMHTTQSLGRFYPGTPFLGPLTQGVGVPIPNMGTDLPG